MIACHDQSSKKLSKLETRASYVLPTLRVSSQDGIYYPEGQDRTITSPGSTVPCEAHMGALGGGRMGVLGFDWNTEKSEGKGMRRCARSPEKSKSLACPREKLNTNRETLKEPASVGRQNCGPWLHLARGGLEKRRKGQKKRVKP